MFLLTDEMTLINVKNIKKIKLDTESSLVEHNFKQSKFCAHLDSGEIITLKIIFTNKNPMNGLQHEDDYNKYFDSLVEKLAQHNLIIE